MNRLESISSCNFIEIDGYAYFSNLFYNALFRVEIKSGKTFFLGSFGKEKISESNIHFEVMQQEGQIYFFPKLGRHMHIYSLIDKTMEAIEIRKESEPFFWIDEVVLNDDSVYFIPKQSHIPIKKMSWDTCKVTNTGNEETIHGEYLSKNKKTIPATAIEKYKISYGEMVSCQQMLDGKWYCFRPVGRQILCFAEGSSNLKTTVLAVENEEELQNYLYDVKRNLFQSRTFFWKDEGFELDEFLEVIKLYDGVKLSRYKEENRYNIGEITWNTMGKNLQ